MGVDVDGDGDNDLVVSQPGSAAAGTNASGNIFVLYNPGNGLVADEHWQGLERLVERAPTRSRRSASPKPTPRGTARLRAPTWTCPVRQRDEGARHRRRRRRRPGPRARSASRPRSGSTRASPPRASLPPAPPTATQGIIFTLDTTLATGASDVALADINGDGRVDVVLAFETGFEVILAPAVGSPTAAGWKAAGAAAEKVAAPAMHIMVVDMDNDGYLDIVTAGASASSADAEKSKTTIYFGSAATMSGGDYSAAASEQVGALTYAEAGAVLALDAADVDGDGWVDVAVAYASTYKRLYLGRRAERGWPAAEATRFGPSSQDAWRLTSLELVDLNLDGNLDVLYAPECTGAACPAYVARGRSKGPIPFDAQAIANQILRMRAIDFAAGAAGASITDVAVTVGEPDHAHAYAGTTNSECRNPADDFYPVRL